MLSSRNLQSARICHERLPNSIPLQAKDTLCVSKARDGQSPWSDGHAHAERAARSQLPFQNRNCPFKKAKVPSHVHKGPFKCPNVLKQYVLFTAQIAHQLVLINNHLVHCFNLVALSPIPSWPTKISTCQHNGAQLVDVKCINTASGCTSCRLPHPKHIHSKGQFEVKQTINLNAVAANLRLNCVKIKTFFWLNRAWIMWFNQCAKIVNIKIKPQTGRQS